MIWDDGIETQHSFKLRIVWMFGSLFSLFYYSVAFCTFTASFPTFHILEGRGQLFKEYFRRFDRCPAGFWFGLVFALVFMFYNLVLNNIYLNSNFFEPNQSASFPPVWSQHRERYSKWMAMKTIANLLRICQTGQLIKESRYWVIQKNCLHFNSNELFGYPNITCLSMLDTK